MITFCYGCEADPNEQSRPMALLGKKSPICEFIEFFLKAPQSTATVYTNMILITIVPNRKADFYYYAYYITSQVYR